MNEYIVIYIIKAKDIGGGMIIHTFGAFYGIGIAFFMNYKNALNNKNFYGTWNSFRIAMIGTLFLWIFWPSFNGALGTTDI